MTEPRHLKPTGERFLDVRAFYINQTGVGEVFVENARKYGLRNVRGIELSLPQKQDVLTHLRQIIEQKRLHIPQRQEIDHGDEHGSCTVDTDRDNMVLPPLRDPL